MPVPVQSFPQSSQFQTVAPPGTSVPRDRPQLRTSLVLTETGLRTSLARSSVVDPEVSVPASEPVVLFYLLISYWNLLHNFFFLNIVAHNFWSTYTAIILYTAATERMVIPFSGENWLNENGQAFQVQTMHYLQNATRSCTSAVHTADSTFSKFSASLE